MSTLGATMESRWPNLGEVGLWEPLSARMSTFCVCESASESKTCRLVSRLALVLSQLAMPELAEFRGAYVLA